ncbi:MAG: hypothetical protein WCB71_14575, partial [Aestuariivirga sp.]
MLEKERRKRIRKLNADLAELVVGLSINEIAARFVGNEDIKACLSEVRADLISNAELFLTPQQEEDEHPFDVSSHPGSRHPLFNRFTVNVLVTHCPDGVDVAPACGAPVVSEEHPTLGKVFGRIDHRSMMG